MNCFRHPDRAAAAFCKGCSKALCLECCQQTFGNQTHVCSEACARTAAEIPDSEDPPDSLWDRIYASIYVIIMVIVLGGGVGGGLVVFGAAQAIDGIEHPPSNRLSLPPFTYSTRRHNYDPRASIFRIFYDLGIRNKAVQFGIGAVFGIAGLALFLKKGWKLTVVGFIVIMFFLMLWTSWHKNDSPPKPAEPATAVGAPRQDGFANNL